MIKSLLEFVSSRPVTAMAVFSYINLYGNDSGNFILCIKILTFKNYCHSLTVVKINPDNVSKLLVTFLVLFNAFLVVGQSASDLLYGRLKANGIITAFYDSSNSAPAIIFRANKLYTDYEHIGFFRIGVLPIVVIEDLTIELNRPESITGIITNLHSWIGKEATSRIEIRKIKILVLNDTTNYLQSGRAKFISNHSCELLDGVSVSAGNIQILAPSAKLQLSDKGQGMIIFDTYPPTTNNFFKMFDLQKNGKRRKENENKNIDSVNAGGGGSSLVRCSNR